MDAGGNPQRKEKKYTPKHPMTSWFNNERVKLTDRRVNKKQNHINSVLDVEMKMPIETRRRVEEKEKTDYFVEEIRSNIIYHNKIFPYNRHDSWSGSQRFR